SFAHTHAPRSSMRSQTSPSHAASSYSSMRNEGSGRTAARLSGSFTVAVLRREMGNVLQVGNVKHPYPARRLDLRRVVIARLANDEKPPADKNQVRMRDVVGLPGAGHEPDGDKRPLAKPGLDIV